MQYNYEYLLKMLRKNSLTAKAINDIRWKLIQGCCANVKTVLDYGSGCNYLTAFAPSGISVDSYDIGTCHEGLLYPQTGIRRDCYDVVCLFDVMEHVDWENNPDKMMLKMMGNVRYLVIAVPIFKGGIFEQWRHYKPGEHLTYFTHQSLNDLLQPLGLALIYQGEDECPPRLDIGTFIYTKGNFNAEKGNTKAGTMSG